MFNPAKMVWSIMIMCKIQAFEASPLEDVNVWGMLPLGQLPTNFMVASKFLMQTVVIRCNQ